MTIKELYEKFSPPGQTPPRPGDLIRTNHYTGLWRPLLVVKTTEKPANTFSFVVTLPDNSTGHSYLNGYVLREDGRLTTQAWPPGSTGYSMNGGGRDGDGRNEILIEERAAQGCLF